MTFDGHRRLCSLNSHHMPQTSNLNFDASMKYREVDKVFDRITNINCHRKAGYTYTGGANVGRLAIQLAWAISNTYQFTRKLKVETCSGSLLRGTGQLELYRSGVWSGNTENIVSVLRIMRKCSSTLPYPAWQTNMLADGELLSTLRGADNSRQTRLPVARVSRPDRRPRRPRSTPLRRVAKASSPFQTHIECSAWTLRGA